MIDISGLNKLFGKNRVLKSINISIEKGNITAIVGPNGSGKTTLIKSILGLVRASSGKITVDGKNILNNYTYRNRIGYMPQAAKYPDNLTSVELLSLVSDLREKKENRVDNLIQLFKVQNEMNKPFKSLSGGTKQKISAIIAFAFNPDIYFLDEPTAGLDPVSSSSFKDLILKEKSENKTVVLTSHIMSEIQELADEIIFLLDGEIKFKGKVEDLLTNKNESKLERALANLMSSN